MVVLLSYYQMSLLLSHLIHPNHLCPKSNFRKIYNSDDNLVFRWFIHFYAFGLIWNAYILFTFVHTCLLNHSLPQGVLKFLLFIKGNSHPSGLDCFSILLTLSLITIQMIRRLYESLFVASFSGRIHLGHYIVGLLFYGLVNLTVVAEIPIPLQQGMEKNM